MRLAKVAGNVVSTIKDESYQGYKLMIVDFLDEHGGMTGERAIAFDAASAGVGDVVLVNVDGGAANMLLDETIVADFTICGVVDSVSCDGITKKYN